MKIIAIIPARGGSKSIPGKNTKILNGKPLIEYIAKAAMGSKFIDKVFLSTENKKIMDIGLKLGLEVPFLRSEDLAKDDTPTLPVIQEMVKLLEVKNIYNPDVIVTLQATSPLCTSDHIDKALSTLKFSPKEASKSLEKLLLSAINNWQSNNENSDFEKASLFIKEIKVDSGSMLKRLRTAPQGRAHRIRKRSNHVTLVLGANNIENL